MEPSTFEQKIVSDAQEASLANYHALNPLPYVALGLGLLSATALISPLFGIFGILALICGTAAALQEDEWTTTAAKVANGFAIALALFFLALIGARQVSRTWTVKSEAEEFINGWFELLRKGEIEQAHQLSMQPQDRQIPEVDLMKYYKESEEARRGRDHFYVAPPLNKLVKDIKQGTIRLDFEIAHERNLEGEYIDRQYSLVVDRGGIKETVPFRVVVRRTVHPKLKVGRWQIYSVTEPQVRAF